MKIPRPIVGLIVAASLVVAVIGLLGFAQAYSEGTNRCFGGFFGQWPKWIGCAMAAHEGLAGGLIGLAGAVFAAWLAYSGTQDQLRQINEDARETSRLRAIERRDKASDDLDALRLAREYLALFANNFPAENDPAYSNYDFVAQLRQLNQGAHVYLSRSARNAPGGFGRSITIVMWRMEQLAEKIDARDAARAMSFQDLGREIQLTLERVRKIIDDLDAAFPKFEQQLRNLSEQVTSLSARRF
jgi:methyl-accepting chemotaxis protein